jgi:peptidoglycan-associated lipoprotein
MLRAALLIACGVGLVGCPKPPPYPNCKKDEHCAERKERCVLGKCQQCIEDKDCAEGQVCTDYQCVDKPECATDGDCPTGSKCEAGACVVPSGSACQIDNECAEGERCKDGRCAPAGCATDTDCGADQACQENRCVSLKSDQPGTGPCEDKDGNLWAAVAFGFNLEALAEPARQRLDRVARCLRTLESAELRILGHADDRGTVEYNLHLGERRARAVKTYLVNLGVAPDKLKVVSYGEERPASEGADETSWAKNRRAELERP